MIEPYENIGEHTFKYATCTKYLLNSIGRTCNAVRLREHFNKNVFLNEQYGEGLTYTAST